MSAAREEGAATAITVQGNIARDNALQINYTMNETDFAFVRAVSGTGSQNGPLTRAMLPFISSTEWERPPVAKPFGYWETATLHVALGTGSGQVQSPFSTEVVDFVRECVDIGFSTAFLSKLVGRRALFEHNLTTKGLIQQPGSETMISHVELGMANYENDAFMVLLRVDCTAAKPRGRAIVFLKLHDALRPSGDPLSLEQFEEHLNSNAGALGQDPFLLANAVLGFYQRRSFSCVSWRHGLYEMKSRLGVTQRADVFSQTGYGAASFDYDKLNAELASISRRAAETVLSASTILDHATALLRLTELLDRGRGEKLATAEEIRSTILRSELFLRESAMVQQVLESMRAVLYNRITKHDSDDENYCCRDSCLPPRDICFIRFFSWRVQLSSQRRGRATDRLSLCLDLSTYEPASHDCDTDCMG